MKYLNSLNEFWFLKMDEESKKLMNFTFIILNLIKNKKLNLKYRFFSDIEQDDESEYSEIPTDKLQIYDNVSYIDPVVNKDNIKKNNNFFFEIEIDRDERLFELFMLSKQKYLEDNNLSIDIENDDEGTEFLEFYLSIPISSKVLHLVDEFRKLSKSYNMEMELENIDIDEDDFEWMEEIEDEQFVILKSSSLTNGCDRLCVIKNKSYDGISVNEQIWDVDNRTKKLRCYASYRGYIKSLISKPSDEYIQKHLSEEKLEYLNKHNERKYLENFYSSKIKD